MYKLYMILRQWPTFALTSHVRGRTSCLTPNRDVTHTKWRVTHWWRHITHINDLSAWGPGPKTRVQTSSLWCCNRRRDHRPESRGQGKGSNLGDELRQLLLSQNRIVISNLPLGSLLLGRNRTLLLVCWNVMFKWIVEIIFFISK